MSRSSKSRHESHGGKVQAAETPQQAHRARPSAQSWYARWGAKRPILRFVVVFGVTMAVFYAITSTPVFERHGLGTLSRSQCPGLRGHPLAVRRGYHGGGPVGCISARPTLDRARLRCHSPTCLFISAVLAAPTSALSKLIGVIAGSVILMLTNLVRIITLFYIRVHYPDAFEVMHVESGRRSSSFWPSYAGRVGQLGRAPQEGDS